MAFSCYSKVECSCCVTWTVRLRSSNQLLLSVCVCGCVFSALRLLLCSVAEVINKGLKVFLFSFRVCCLTSCWGRFFVSSRVQVYSLASRCCSQASAALIPPSFYLRGSRLVFVFGQHHLSTSDFWNVLLLIKCLSFYAHKEEFETKTPLRKNQSFQVKEIAILHLSS